MALTKVKPGGIHADLSSAISGSANASAISGSHTSGFEFAGTVSGSSISTGSFGRVEVAGNLTVTGTDNVGITTASQWRLATTFTTGGAFITSNLEEVDAPAGYSTMGSGMGESSGVFSFPSTGYWLILFNTQIYYDTDRRYCLAQIHTTVDDGTYLEASTSLNQILGGTLALHSYGSMALHYIFDVTSVSTHKVKFKVGGVEDDPIASLGESGANYTSMVFIRLGDT